MAEIDIHGFKVKYDDNSHTVNNAVKFLGENLSKDEARIFFEDAHRDHVNHTAHFEVFDHHRNKDTNLTLVHEGDGTYHLRKRLPYQ